MHILYCIAGLYRPAGMERVLSDKANWLCAHGYRVSILTTEQKGRPLAFPLDPRIQLRDLGIGYEDNNGGSLWDKLIHYPRKQRQHRKALELVLREWKPDICISMFCNEVNLLPGIQDGSVKMLEVHFSRLKRLQYERKGLWRLADRWRSYQDGRLVRRYSAFVVLSEEDKALWGAVPQIRVIPNPVHFSPQAPLPLDTCTVIAVGRYAHQKGFDRLLDAWARIPDKEGWTLRLVGNGDLRGELERQISELGLSSSVSLGKYEGDMEKTYSEASVLALSSRYEGLPMALLEAQTFGIPCVSFDCKCGPREVIEDGVSGILVKDGDVDALALGLRQLMTDGDLRKEMGQNAFRRAERWKMDIIMEKWTKLFEEILSSRR